MTLTTKWKVRIKCITGNNKWYYLKEDKDGWFK